jgi:xanthine/CO dehydrogenase XdhC/CoxF family maturation factor
VRSAVEADIDDRTDVVVTDHDRPELGDVLASVLATPARWVGVMGSPRHTAPHVEALQQRGVPEETIGRVHRPIGLDIGSRSPAEIAGLTVAGLLADRAGRDGGTYAREGRRAGRRHRRGALPARLQAAVPDAELTVVVNTGDDITLYGLRICPTWTP